MIRIIETRNPEHTEAVGAWLARQLTVGDLVALIGPLGVGKTTLARGVAKAWGYEGHVRSPSFTLVNQYPTNPPLTHADLYRLGEEGEMLALDLETALEEGVVLIEWADTSQLAHELATWRVELEILDNVGIRRIRLEKINAEDPLNPSAGQEE